MKKSIEEYRDLITSWKNQEVDIIYHPHTTYRLVKEGKAIITNAYSNFFEIEIFTETYGSYHTTISYKDLYTQVCKISLHKKHDET